MPFVIFWVVATKNPHGILFPVLIKRFFSRIQVIVQEFVALCEEMWPGISDDVIALYAPNGNLTDDYRYEL